MKDTLKAHGLRLTLQRLELLRILDKLGKKHPSFSEICEEVKNKYPSISRSTILKNLDEMVKIGLIDSFSFTGQTHYEMNPHPHVNLVDSKGTIVDIDSEEIGQLLTQLLQLVDNKAGVKTRHLMILAQ